MLLAQSSWSWPYAGAGMYLLTHHSSNMHLLWCTSFLLLVRKGNQAQECLITVSANPADWGTGDAMGTKALNISCNACQYSKQKNSAAWPTYCNSWLFCEIIKKHVNFIHRKQHASNVKINCLKTVTFWLKKRSIKNFSTLILFFASFTYCCYFALGKQAQIPSS